MIEPQDDRSSQESDSVAIGEAAGDASDPAVDTSTAGRDQEADPLAELRAEVARWQDLALRSQADLDNYRKRMAREKAEAISFANASLLEDLMPIIDHFHLGLAAAREEKSSTIFQGMAMVLKQIEDFLKDHGVETIETAGADFDPHLHEAVAHEFSDTVEEGKIIRELRPGFKLRDRLLRASNIVVSKGRPDRVPARSSPPGREDHSGA